MIISAIFFILGFFLMLVTIFKYPFFWDNQYLKRTRNKIGDTETAFILLLISFLLLYFGSKFIYHSDNYDQLGNTTPGICRVLCYKPAICY